MKIVDNFLNIRQSIPSDVKIVAVSKLKPLEDILCLYNNTGHRIFGESRAQELVVKNENINIEDIQWHFIGNFQTNKVKQILPIITLTHSVSNVRLLNTINKVASNNNFKAKCLLQFHIAEEETKQGFDIDEVLKLFDKDFFAKYPNVEIEGVMGMATFTDDEIAIAKEFKLLRSYFDILKNEFFSDRDSFSEISMGMSNDYKIAIAEGSTMVRIGSSIFGERN